MNMPMKRKREDRPTKDSEDDYMEEDDKEECDPFDLQTNLSILDMRLEKISNPDDPKLPELIRLRREIRAKLEIRRLKNKIKEIEASGGDLLF